MLYWMKFQPNIRSVFRIRDDAIRGHYLTGTSEKLFIGEPNLQIYRVCINNSSKGESIYCVCTEVQIQQAEIYLIYEENTNKKRKLGTNVCNRIINEKRMSNFSDDNIFWLCALYNFFPLQYFIIFFIIHCTLSLMSQRALGFFQSNVEAALSNQNMASKIKDTHASWQNLFNRDAITPRLESKDPIIQPTYQKIICRIYTYLVIIQMITLKKK